MIKWLLILTMLFLGLNLSAENAPPGWFTKTNINGIDVIISINPPFYDPPKFHSDLNNITNRATTITNVNFINQIQDVELVGGFSSSVIPVNNKEYSELDLVKIKLARLYDCGEDNTIIRTCVINHDKYMVQYVYYPNGPSYFIDNKEHWPAFIIVSEYVSLRVPQDLNTRVPISWNGTVGKFIGELVLGGGSVDIPQNMVYQALGLTNRVTESKDWIAESWEDKASIEKK